MDLSTAIDAFFASAFAPEQWTESLDILAQAAGADGATLVFGPSGPRSVARSGSLIGIVEEYFKRNVEDTRERRVRPTMSDGFQGDLDFFSQDEIDRDPFYQEFLIPRSFGWHGVALLAEESQDVVLSLKRKLHRGPFERTQFDALGRALPYLRATANAAAAAYNHSLGNELESLARAGFGAALLDQGGRVITSNAELQLGDGLIMVAGELRAAHRDDQAALESAIRLALRPEHPSRLPPPRRAIVRRRLSRHPLLVDVLPLIGASGVSLFRAAAMLVVTDLSRSVSPEISELRHVFGLTTREAQLAARLATGMPLESAANELHISTSHARQRLKAIFQKTDTHRQAELTALLARLSRLHLPRR